MSTSGSVRQQDLHSLSDAQLCALLREHNSASGSDLSDVMGEVFARHHGAVLAYARTCCRDLATANDLAAEAFARTYRAVAWGAGPEHAWRPYLLTCVRRVAADWARRGARTQLSDDFEKWAAELPDGQEAEGAVLSAEEGSLVLRAYRSLPERWQAVLWHAVVEHEPATETARRLGISAGGVGSLAARAREGLREAYLRAHLDQSASEECRHYGGLLATALRRPGKRVTRDLGRHLQACADCARAERDLRSVNNRLGALLPAGILLWYPASFLPSVGGHGAQLAAAKLGGLKLGGLKLTSARFGAAKWAVTAAVVAGTTLTAFVLLPGEKRMEEEAAPYPTPAGAFPNQAPDPDLSASMAPVVSIAVAVSGTATASPAPSTPAPDPGTSASASASASPSADPGRGLPLVNTASGLCVGPAGNGSDGPLQLQRCSGDASQGWQRLSAGHGTYQLRNTGSGTCLDGTTSGGNLVDVALRPCRSDAGRETQLWRFDPVARPGAFRLWFVPRVQRSDYANHLLGPRNWPKGDRLCAGSTLVHLPDYYNSANFHFTLG
ncbi:sigma-70 family RNA polymerase sigma factor [Streptomyces sp. NBC_01565]|uniref:sigma-70 family RNA polymerase sigma factor n=1 Tax=unclassified Streptomyces TaxID=2593676 RepID=UPI00225A0C9F|nr:sigma-70 family RNA polymerase sigma factor [Streptomyces sp. NBC_01565]MCX4546138.1 sigma-70 family RNA polymerase sigma factor [Streptomyces sp. NBC_01565]